MTSDSCRRAQPTAITRAITRLTLNSNNRQQHQQQQQEQHISSSECNSRANRTCNTKNGSSSRRCTSNGGRQWQGHSSMFTGLQRSPAPATLKMSGRGGIWHAKRTWGQVPAAAFDQQLRPWRFCGYCGRPCSAMWLFCVGCRAKLHELPPHRAVDAYGYEVSADESDEEDDDDDNDSAVLTVVRNTRGPRPDPSASSAGGPTSARPLPTSAERGRTRSPSVRPLGSKPRPQPRFN